MNPTEKRNLKFGVIVLLVLVVLGFANDITRQLWSPLVLGDNPGSAEFATYADIGMITSLCFFAGYMLAYAKLMGAGKIRSKALVLLVLLLVSFVMAYGVGWLVTNLTGSYVVYKLGITLPLHVIGLISSIVLIGMLEQAAREAGGKLPKVLPAVYLGLVAVAFVVGLVGLGWQLSDFQAWEFDPTSSAATAKAIVNGIRSGAGYIVDGIELVACAIVLRAPASSRSDATEPAAIN